MDVHTENGNTPRTICRRTGVRAAACACALCSSGQSPDMKLAANRRDVLALLDLIAGCIENHPSQVGEPNWARVGDIAHLREQLRDAVVGLTIGPDGSDFTVRRRIEEALCAGDENVDEALIAAM